MREGFIGCFDLRKTKLRLSTLNGFSPEMIRFDWTINIKGENQSTVFLTEWNSPSFLDLVSISCKYIERPQLAAGYFNTFLFLLFLSFHRKSNYLVVSADVVEDDPL